MKLILSLVMSLACMLLLVGCGSPGMPQPIKVLENPTTGERARFFPEIAYKVPADYDQSKHIASWTVSKQQVGFTREISPADDRESFTEEQAKNRARKGL